MILVVVHGLVSGPRGDRASDPPVKPGLTVDGVLEGLGLSPDQKASLLDDEIVVSDLDAVGENDIGVALAMFVPHPTGEVMDFLFSEEGVKLDPSVRSFKEFAGEKLSEDDLKGATFDGEESSELDKLIDASEGYDVNLRSEEIEKFQAVRKEFPDSSPDSDGECAAAVNRAYRRILLERCRAFQGGGPDAVPDYARGDAKSLPGSELRLALDKDRLLAERFPEVRRALAEYPKGGRKEFQSSLYWLKELLDGRPAISLGHRLLHRWTDGGILVDRQFYVGHSYNSLHTVTGVIPLEKGSLVFCSYRMSTDEVTGFGSGLKRLLATKELKSDIEEQLKGLKPRLAEWLKTRPKGKPMQGTEQNGRGSDGPAAQKHG